MINESLATLDNITHWAPAASCAQLQMLRLDLLHHIVSGNKWFKLKYNAAAALAAGKDTLLSFGGGYSNHLVATAFAARECGLKSVGILRGHYEGGHVTQTMRDCEAYGMRLIQFGKAAYATLSIQDLQAEFPCAYIIPEGGANEFGIRGAEEIAALIPEDATDVCLAVGTGTTLNGLYSALPPRMRLHGFYVAMDFERTQVLLRKTASHLLPEVLFHQVQNPRFGKWTIEAMQFICAFKAETGIPLDVVYTSKMMMKVYSLLAQDLFAPSAKIVCIHTGGLQGNPAGIFSA